MVVVDLARLGGHDVSSSEALVDGIEMHDTLGHGEDMLESLFVSL